MLTQVKGRALDAQARADIAAEFQTAIVEVVVAKSLAALKRTGLKQLVVAGGVGANLELRARLTQAAAGKGLQVFYPALEFCTDNGAMIAFAAALRIQDSGFRTQDSEKNNFSVRPRWNLGALQPVNA